MQFLPLLGKHLKDDEIIDVLDSMDMEVIYDFDKLHEGQPDCYWASSKKDGFRFRFDEAQTLNVIFIYTLPNNGFAGMPRNGCDVPFFTTIGEAEASGLMQKLEVTKGEADFLGVSRKWVRLAFATYSTHYEFRSGDLALVTITKKDEL
jgi:hypothetical protein